MNFVRRRHRPISIFFILFFYLSQLLLNWPILNLFKLRGNSRFMDLKSVLVASDCYSSFQEKIYKQLSGSGCEYIYGRSLIYFIKLIHINEISTLILGSLLLASFLIILIYFSFYFLSPKILSSFFQLYSFVALQ